MFALAGAVFSTQKQISLHRDNKVVLFCTVLCKARQQHLDTGRFPLKMESP